jgi:hypothetical protein
MDRPRRPLKDKKNKQVGMQASKSNPGAKTGKAVPWGPAGQRAKGGESHLGGVVTAAAAGGEKTAGIERLENGDDEAE